MLRLYFDIPQQSFSSLEVTLQLRQLIILTRTLQSTNTPMSVSSHVVAKLVIVSRKSIVDNRNTYYDFLYVIVTFCSIL